MHLARRCWACSRAARNALQPSLRAAVPENVAAACPSSCSIFDRSAPSVYGRTGSSYGFTTSVSPAYSGLHVVSSISRAKVCSVRQGGADTSLYPSAAARGYSSSTGKGDNLISREWLRNLWADDLKMWRANKVGKARKRDANDVTEGSPVLRYSAQEVGVENLFKQSSKIQVNGDYLTPRTPEEVILEPLLSRPTLVIARDIEWANIMFAFEQESRYVMIDPFFPHLPAGHIREKSNVLFRQLLRSRRPFVAYITDESGNELFRVRRPIWWINSTIYVEVNGKEIGVVRRRWHLWRRIYDLYLGNEQFAVVENPGFWNWTFTLKDSEDSVIAQIDRAWRGMGLELFTDAGQYIIRFGDRGSGLPAGLDSYIEELNVSHPLTLSERAVALALAVSLDSDYFSRRGGWGLPFLVMTE